VKFQRRPSGNFRPICEGCRSLQNASRLYGLRPEEYLSLLQAQDGKCAVCKTPAIDQIHKTFKRLVVDHVHNSGKVRGLLCAKCNFGIGQFNDSPALLAAAIQYLSQ
jgi:hypothetical protein